MLPLSTVRLTALFFSVPVVLGVLSAVVRAVAGDAGASHLPLLLICLIQAITITGLGGLTLATTVILNTSSRFFFILIFTTGTVLGIELTQKHPEWALAFGLVAAIASPLWLFHSLKHSSKPYQFRQMFGMKIGGMQMGPTTGSR